MMTLNSASVAGLLLTLSGLAAYELTQETSKSVTLKSTVKILCTAQDDRYYISWYQQKPGGAPKFLLRNNERAPGLPSRFTYTDSNNQDYLNINGIEAEDEAVYYCGCAPSLHSAAVQRSPHTKTFYIHLGLYTSVSPLTSAKYELDTK
uniref:Ig-like domain-containing protein n=1 Tax=Pygocentrus nattereri TaxID=42514 RepID=A0AAR2K3I3_PYGNA